MRLLRAILAVVLFWASNGLYRIAVRLRQPANATEVSMLPAERILLGSLVGIAICAVWITITWRAAL